MKENRSAYRILVGKPEGKSPGTVQDLAIGRRIIIKRS
jgi:hypothetical protein